MKEVIIDRSKWWRGKGEEESRLLNSHGQMCCLGFVCEAFGASSEQLREVSWPTSVLGWNLPIDLKWLEHEEEHHRTEVNIGITNDDPHESEAAREAFVVKTFAEHDIQITFVN